MNNPYMPVMHPKFIVDNDTLEKIRQQIHESIAEGHTGNEFVAAVDKIKSDCLSEERP